MRKLFVCSCIIVHVAAIPLVLQAQDRVAPISSAGAFVMLSSEPDGAQVILDSIPSGITPLTLEAVAPGWHHVRLIHPDTYNWLTGTVSDSFFVHPGDSIAMSYTFRPRYLITTNPFGADVLIGDSLLGTTPLVFRGDPSVGHSPLKIRKSGYEQTTIDFLDNSRGVVALDLKKLWEGSSAGVIPSDDAGGSSSLRLYITGAGTILSGVAAAYFKVRADNQHSVYVRNPDPALLRQIERLDKTSAIFLAATQLGLGLFTYFVLSE